MSSATKSSSLLVIWAPPERDCSYFGLISRHYVCSNSSAALSFIFISGIIRQFTVGEYLSRKSLFQETCDLLKAKRCS
jgi:hypothetical protein